MSKSLALISGKGGSGKTTLSLSIASLLSKCGLKVLLIDCDIATNGATYFYENKLENSSISFTSFYEILTSKFDTCNFMQISDNFYFLPSIKNIKNESLLSSIVELYFESTKNNFEMFYNSNRELFDIILFDCQAGYSELLKIILPNSDINLAVMEADAISSSAMRSLYLKIGNIISNKKIFQVFNKVNEEEYNIYSKISGGTVFTNIEAIKFDWTIRKSFAVSQVPDLTNTSSNFGQQVFNICNIFCNILFNESEQLNKLNSYKTHLDIAIMDETIEKLEMRIEELRNERRATSNKLIKTIYVFLLPIVFTTVFLSLYLILDMKYEWSFITTIFVSVFSLMIMLINLFETIKNRQDKNSEIVKLQKELDKLNKDLNRIQ